MGRGRNASYPAPPHRSGLEELSRHGESVNWDAAKFLSFGWKQRDLRKSLSEDR